MVKQRQSIQIGEETHADHFLISVFQDLWHACRGRQRQRNPELINRIVCAKLSDRIKPADHRNIADVLVRKLWVIVNESDDNKSALWASLNLLGDRLSKTPCAIDHDLFGITAFFAQSARGDVQQSPLANNQKQNC